MQLKKAISLFLESKESLSSYGTYRSCSKYLMVTINLKVIDLAGDLLTSERTKRIRKTKDLFQKVEKNLKGKSQNTKFFTITMLKSILKMVEDTDGSRFWDAYKVSQEKKDIVILDTEFAKDFVNDKAGVYDNLSDKLKTVWELSAVMLTTCLRFSDAKNLTSDNLDDCRVTIKNQKTGVVTSSPIPAKLAAILTSNHRKGSLYTMDISKDSCYRSFPALFVRYDEMHKQINGVPFYNAVKFHVFRKTAISLMLAMGVPQSIVMRASGHSVGSKAFARYVGHVETVFNTEINNFQTKFYG